MAQKKAPKPKKKKKKLEPHQEEKQIVIVNNIQPATAPELELRAINLYGDITEKRAADTIAGLLFLENTSHIITPEDPTDPSSPEFITARPISMYISTHGGAAAEMFSLLDVMGMIKKRTCDIETTGMGKVMSAGVPILAAGSKGKRKVGRNCRIMLHNVLAGTGGTIFSMENELDEIRWVQDRYIECLASYTKLTPSKIKKILKAQKDVYISAEEAIKMGIADEII